MLEEYRLEIQLLFTILIICVADCIVYFARTGGLWV